MKKVPSFESERQFFKENKPEYEPKRVFASIRLEFFRHDAKAKKADGQSDTTLRLSETGRTHSTEVGKGKAPRPEVAIAHGSPRERSLETSMRQMLAGEEEITPDLSLEQMREVIDKRLKVGKKEIQTDKLDFNWPDGSKFRDAAMKHYTEDKDYMRFMVEESDRVVKELGDKEATSYTRNAGNIAEIIKKYLEILPAWQRIASQNPDKYSKYKNEMQRFFGSHATVTEAFLMKALEKTQGRDAVMKLIESMPDKTGFGESEGYSVNLTARPGGSEINISYKGNSWDIPTETIDKIIAERKAFDAEIDESHG